MKYVIGGLLLIMVFLGIASLSEPDPPPTFIIPTPNVEYPVGRAPMALPPDYQTEFVHYATVDRVDGMTRNIYISPQAIEAIEADVSLPDYTIVVIEAFHAQEDNNGRFVRDNNDRWIADEFEPEVHVAELRSTWRIEDLAASSHLGGWNFDAFDYETGVSNPTRLNDCFSCHDGAVRRDFLFTMPLLETYVRTGEVQYRYCGLPERSVCR